MAVHSAAADGNVGGGTGDAFAQGVTTGAVADGGDVTVNAGIVQGTTSPTTRARSGSGWTCTSQAIDPVTAVNLINENPDTRTTMAGGAGSGTWYVIACPGTTPSLLFEGNAGQQGTQAPLAQPRALAQEALATLHLPAPALRMSPPSSAEVVNFQEWLWVDGSIWHPISATATAGPVSATAIATPERVVYDMGNGARIACKGPGTAYNPSVAADRQSTTCSYTYPNSSAGQPNNHYAATATVYWSVRWSAVGAPGGGNLGVIPGAVTSIPVEVDEIQAVNVASGTR